ncbi:hypothetical protein GCM10007301_45350 [Azorhizobium oxalatiphilum]|uniref:Methyltransferase FkbM domain-containing protein n=1 Tax=Azorhizobium oxalatiphilum TaxID=980631 RepID=A0A917CAV2_9HYPH|nr:FkbM family methyltransferase [Azorhizobium oxalatiphilum]GGF80159.1 hypothetical protein GCM10007301_45350 [Azorhizobium oxalatiphilum]
MSIELQMYPGYSNEELNIIREFAVPDQLPEHGFIKEFIGVRTRNTSVYNAAAQMHGNSVCGLPIPADFHSEAVEWIGTLKAVRNANQRFAVMELGAGYGTWSVATAVAARNRGITDIFALAVEGDPGHFRTMQDHYRDNGFDPAEHQLLQAAVGSEDGKARWPKVDNSADVWGLRPQTEDGTDYTGGQHSDYLDVEIIALNRLLLARDEWNLIHIDVQGMEFDICRSAIDRLSERARWVVVGTHSRKIDGDLLDLFNSAGWLLENEKPTRFTFVPGAASLEAMTQFDGTQVWRNPRFAKTES